MGISKNFFFVSDSLMKLLKLNSHYMNISIEEKDIFKILFCTIFGRIFKAYFRDVIFQILLTNSQKKKNFLFYFCAR